jgi:phage/plasmid-like protein (TIGR03299 family)
MAHEFETGFFVGQPAWHGLGVILNDAPTVEDAIRCAGLDWKVRLAPLQLTEDGRAVNHQATIRESDNSILGVVGPGFVPLQNVDAFGWFQPFVDNKMVKLEAAGALRSGKKVWILARTAGGEVDIIKNDPVTQYVLLAHAHDGSLAIRVGFTTVRVVCANTLSAALDTKSASKLIKIAHTKGTKTALESVREVMDLARGEFVATTEKLQVLARHGCDEMTLRRYVRTVFDPERADDEKAAKPTIAQVLPLFEAGRGSELSRGTLWGAFNAITEFTTHEQGKSQNARLESQWFGKGVGIARRALDVGLAFAAAA